MVKISQGVSLKPHEQESHFSFSPSNIAGLLHQAGYPHPDVFESVPRPHRSEYLVDQGIELNSSERRDFENRNNPKT